MSQLSMSHAWDETRQIFARDGGLLSAVALALLVLPEIVAGLVAPPAMPAVSTGGRVLALVAAFIGVIGQLALIRLALGPSTTVGEAIRHGARRFPAAFGALVLLMIGIAVVLIPLLALALAGGMISMPAEGSAPTGAFGTILLVLIVLSLFLAVKFIMTVPIASAENIGPLAILKRSWNLTKGRYWPLFGLELLLLIAALALLVSAQFVGGSLAQILGGDVEPFSLGALILAVFMGVAQAAFTVLASVMLARIYAQLSGTPEARPSVPTTGI